MFKRIFLVFSFVAYLILFYMQINNHNIIKEVYGVVAILVLISLGIMVRDIIRFIINKATNTLKSKLQK